MADHILVFAEHQAAKLTRPTWEALAAGQRLAQDLGRTASAVLLGSNLAPLALELAAVAVQEVLTVDSPWLAEYTADGYTHALRAVIEEAVAKKAPLVEIIPGKGSGALKKHVLKFLDRKDMKALYHRVEKDSRNWGRVFVHFRWK